MAKPDENISKIAGWLSEFEPDKQEQLLKQIRLKSVTDAPAEDLLQAPISTLGDYLEMDLPIPPEVVKPGLIVRGEIHSLSSRAGKGKTTFTLNRFVRWAAGLPLFADLPEVMAPAEPVKTLIIENEGSAGYFQDRMKDIINHGGYNEAEIELIRQNILVWGDGSYSGVKVDDGSKLEILRRGVKKWEPDIVFLDPFRSIWQGDENDGSQMHAAVDSLQQLASDFDCAVCMNHHEGKGKDNSDAMDFSRGSTVLEGACATMERWTHVKGGVQSEISWAKKRYGRSIPPVRVEFNFDTWTYEHVGESALDRQILALLGGAPDVYLSVSEIADELEETERKVRDRLGELADESRVQKVRNSHGPGFSYRIQTSDPDEPSSAGRLEVG